MRSKGDQQLRGIHASGLCWRPPGCFFLGKPRILDPGSFASSQAGFPHVGTANLQIASVKSAADSCVDVSLPIAIGCHRNNPRFLYFRSPALDSIRYVMSVVDVLQGMSELACGIGSEL